MGVVLLTDDAENCRLAEEQGLDARRVRPFVQSLPDASELLDVLASEEGDADADADAADGAKRRAKASGRRYRAHLPLSDLRRGLEGGDLHQGKLRVNRHNSGQAYVSVSSV